MADGRYGTEGGGEGKWGPRTGAGPGRGIPSGKCTSQRDSSAGLGSGWGLVGHGEEMPNTRDGTPFPVPSCTPALYTSLFISVQNHVPILHKEHPTLHPTHSPHVSALALGSISPDAWVAWA